jgi:cystathionine gamma-synthase
MTYLKPKTIAISDGYHGCHGVVDILQGLYGLKKIPLPTTEEEWEKADLGPGDVVHVETPLNPTGEAKDLATISKYVAIKGASLTVDATFGPPPLQDPFLYGARVIMHSGTKYIGGHSDLLCGVLACSDRKDFVELFKQRVYLGSVIGNMESWLGVRSLRTLEVRVKNQSFSAEQLALWLHSSLSSGSEADEETKIVQSCVETVQHASIQVLDPENAWVKKQMPNGFGPVFSMTMKDKQIAKRIPGKLHYFHHATSLGGVESLIEWRRMSDPTVDPKLMRVSVGLERWEDLKEDLLRGMKAVLEDIAESKA